MVARRKSSCECEDVGGSIRGVGGLLVPQTCFLGGLWFRGSFLPIALSSIGWAWGEQCSGS